MLGPTLFALTILFGALLLVEAGRRLGRAAVVRDPDAFVANGVFDSNVYTLLALLLGFTFSNAATRFDGRRELMGREANAIGTAYLRMDLLPDETRLPIQAKFRQYVDSRILMFTAQSIEGARAELARSHAIQAEIWASVIAAMRALDAPPAAVVMLPPLNEMFDISTTQLVAMQTHPPKVIYYMLGGLTLVAALLAGYGMGAGKKRHTLHTMVFSVAFASTTYVIMDIEYPRLGLIRVDSASETLVDLRASMK